MSMVTRNNSYLNANPISKVNRSKDETSMMRGKGKKKMSGSDPAVFTSCTHTRYKKHVPKWFEDRQGCGYFEGLKSFFELNASNQGKYALYPCLDQCSQMKTILTTNSIPNPRTYIEEGYSITRTDAPKDLVGRGEVNLARTTPELPVGRKIALVRPWCKRATCGQRIARGRVKNIPCGRVTLPQMTRILDPRISFWPR